MVVYIPEFLDLRELSVQEAKDKQLVTGTFMAFDGTKTRDVYSAASFPDEASCRMWIITNCLENRVIAVAHQFG